jgi:N-acetylneuraminic acid mutarotase
MADTASGWRPLPSCPSHSGEWSLCAAQSGRLFALGKRVYEGAVAGGIAADGFCFDPESEKWRALAGDFPPPAGTAFAWGGDKVIFLGGADKLLPTDPDHPGFSDLVRIYDVRREKFVQSMRSPRALPVTTAVAARGDTFWVASGESRPGVRSPLILKGTITTNE